MLGLLKQKFTNPGGVTSLIRPAVIASRSYATGAKEMTVRDALNSALDEEMSADPTVFVMGEEHLRRYGFRTSFMDIPLVSLIRSLVITCVYSLCDGPGLSHGPYLGTTSFCSFVSILILSVKACLFSANGNVEAAEGSATSLARQKLHLNKSWGMPVLFLSSLVFALGHIVIAYRTNL
ncbi:hypothetical protein IFM89_016263 [Coptis chinensis]|uniref:Uncharacterized protein n=1 Tax=Coptis chinensis TaxID=261450 RepID=A0A835LFB7_9MAGN|nr:hypothetical protein IFM89_016263 [Coptis chinensis]